ncbi:MAG: DUF4139 domain-containing protein [Candidatus Marinimicrobia bacterium]|nr:DUF4139 domain-containing protein [Candidatus Neomarinimicrobiota bacterium]
MKPANTIPLIVLSIAFLNAQTAIPVSAADRTGLEVTIYNQNLGLVKDTRTFKLAKGGRVELLLEEVAPKVQTETVLPVPQGKGRFTVLEQNYEYDLLTPRTLLSKYVGKQVELLTYDQNNKLVERKKATLLSLNEKAIYQVGNDIHIEHPGEVVLPEVPDDLVARPSLRWLAEADKGSHTVQISYLTGGMSWKADYVLKVNPDKSSADITGWITLNNESGIAYPDAAVKLVAGTIHRAGPKKRPRREGLQLAMRAAPQVREEAFMDYHLYTIPWSTTIGHKQQKQVELLSQTGIAVEQEYTVSIVGAAPGRQRSSDPKRPVMTTFNFRNSAANKLGMPLPAGIVRIYSADQAGSLQFAGEDRIGHTPRDEPVRLTAGQAFDLVAEMRRTNYQNLGSRDQIKYEQSTEVALRNRKPKGSARIKVYARFNGDWDIQKSNQDFVKEDAFTALFTVDVPAGKEVKITYTARVEQ